MTIDAGLLISGFVRLIHMDTTATLPIACSDRVDQVARPHQLPSGGVDSLTHCSPACVRSPMSSLQQTATSFADSPIGIDHFSHLAEDRRGQADEATHAHLRRDGRGHRDTSAFRLARGRLFSGADGRDGRRLISSTRDSSAVRVASAPVARTTGRNLLNQDDELETEMPSSSSATY